MDSNSPEQTIGPDGTEAWYLNDQLHRTDGPAVRLTNGTEYWYLNGRRHRTDGPALIYADGTQEWYGNGQLHRTNGPAVIYADGTQEWYVNGHPLTELEIQVQKFKQWLTHDLAHV